jgi:hypothetical protein
MRHDGLLALSNCYNGRHEPDLNRRLFARYPATAGDFRLRRTADAGVDGRIRRMAGIPGLCLKLSMIFRRD